MKNMKVELIEFLKIKSIQSLHVNEIEKLGSFIQWLNSLPNEEAPNDCKDKRTGQADSPTCSCKEGPCGCRVLTLNKRIKHVIEKDFEIIDFEKTPNDIGRCINCDANEICGSGFPCPCTMTEQLREIK